MFPGTEYCGSGVSTSVEARREQPEGRAEAWNTVGQAKQDVGWAVSVRFPTEKVCFMGQGRGNKAQPHFPK